MNNSKHSEGGEEGFHQEPSFWRRYIFSTDHKVIGIQYSLSALFFLLFGFLLIMFMRWSIAYPDKPLPGIDFFRSLPWAGHLFSEKWAPEGKIRGDLYNMFGAIHGTIMVFMGVVPLVFGGFGNFVVPLQVGAPDMAFPRLNMASYWIYLSGGLLMLASFFLPSGAALSGWTSYPPLSTLAQMESPWFSGQTWWLVSMVLIITSSLLGSVNVITTVVNLRAKGMTWMRLPFFTWAVLVTAFLLLLAFPPLEVAGILQLMDRVAGTSFFSPTGLVVDSKEVVNLSGGGSPLLYQHLFWFLGHPEVYVLLLPPLGAVADVIANNTRKPLFGYRLMVAAVLILGFLSLFVWAHHMYLTGMGPWIGNFFQTTTVIVSIPSVIMITCLLISLWGGSIRFTPPMLFALAFLPMFGIGGLTGLPLGFNYTDLYLHDTYYVIAHFHYVLAPGILFGAFAGVYYWYPKAFGRSLNVLLGHFHFWSSLVFMNLVFLPMFFQGMGGFHRRWYDGGASFPTLTREEFRFLGLTETLLDLNVVITWATYGLALSQIFFMINLFLSLKAGKKAGGNPWEATTLEWATPTPPPHGNFLREPVVHRPAYEYSLPGAKDGYAPQHLSDRELGLKDSPPDGETPV